MAFNIFVTLKCKILDAKLKRKASKCVRDYMDTTVMEGQDGMLDQKTNLFSH